MPMLAIPASTQSSTHVRALPSPISGRAEGTPLGEVDGRFDNFFPKANASVRKSFKAIGNSSTTAAQLKSFILKIIHHLQKN